MDEVQPWGSPGALGQPPLRIRSKRAQRVFCSIAPSSRAEGGWWECQGGMGGRVRQVGESKGGDGRPERSFGTEEMRGCWDLNKERLLKNPNRTLPPGERWPKAAGSTPRIAAGYQPAGRSAPGGVSTADSGGGPRRMTLHLAGGSSLRAPCVPGARQHRGQRRPAPQLPLSAGPPRAPSPPPLPLKNELVSLLLWGWVFFCLFLFFFFIMLCVCVFF